MNHNGEMSRLRKFHHAHQLELRMFGLVILLASVLSVMNPHFRTAVNLYNLMDQTVTIGIASIGASLVILTGGIDLSVGSVLGFSAILLGTSFGEWNAGAAGSLAICLGAGALAHCFFCFRRISGRIF